MEGDPSAERHSSQKATSTPFVQVCDRCRWKKIKCDGAKPCSNCRAVGFPCETRARLSKQATPRSYVQYLEARVRHLEGEKESEWPRKVSSSYSPYAEASLKKISSPGLGAKSSRHESRDWSTFGELGSYLVDEDGFNRYMGPSSGVGFTAAVMQELLEDEQPPDGDFYGLFSLDDSTKGKWLAESDILLFQVHPSNLPDHTETARVLRLFFLYTERIFPVLHQPTFKDAVDHLYSVSIDSDVYELLAQFYLALSIGYCFDVQRNADDRIRDQIRALQTACRCQYTILHTKRDGLMRLQTLALQSYALLLLRQRSESMRISAMANQIALDIGLHHDGNRFNGNPLETQMRRRVFWCVFMVHVFNSSLHGFPQTLLEADISIAEPDNVDDEQITSTEVLSGVPGRTKIHRFVTVCRLARILSRTLDVLYTHKRRSHASTKIDQMNRLCCEHLLDQLDFSFEELPDDLPETDSENPEDLSILASFANEQLLYHYIRWLIHKPGLTLPRNDPHFAARLQMATEAAANLLQTSDTYKCTLPYIKCIPPGHPLVIFVASLTPLYRSKLLQSQPAGLAMLGYSASEDYEACMHGIASLSSHTWDRADGLRKNHLVHLVSKVFGGKQPMRQQREDSGASIITQMTQQSQASNTSLTSYRSQTPNSSQPSRQSQTSQTSYQSQAPSSLSATQYQTSKPQEAHQFHMDYQEQRFEDLTANENLRDFVHEAFSPNTDPWAGLGGYGVEPGSHTPRGH